MTENINGMAKKELLNNSGGERKKESEKELLNNIIKEQLFNNQPRGSFIIKSIAFLNTPQNIRFIEDLKTRARIDGWSFTRLAIEAFKEYLEKHPVPNPQTQLNRFETNMPAKPSWQCFVPNCRAKVKYKLELKNFEGKNDYFLVCEKHKKWRHPEFRFLIDCREVWLKEKGV